TQDHVDEHVGVTTSHISEVCEDRLLVVHLLDVLLVFLEPQTELVDVSCASALVDVAVDRSLGERPAERTADPDPHPDPAGCDAGASPEKIIEKVVRDV